MIDIEYLELKHRLDFLEKCRQHLRGDAARIVSVRLNAWERLIKKIGGPIHGTALKTKDGRYAIITADQEPGKTRYTCFDEKGPIGHGVYNSAVDALVECFNMGYRKSARPSELDNLYQQTPRATS